MYFWCHRFDQNSNKNTVRISVVKSFVASSGLPESFFGLPGDLISNVINKEDQRKPKQLPGSPQKATKKWGQKSRNIFVGILNETDFSYKDILKLTNEAFISTVVLEIVMLYQDSVKRLFLFLFQPIIFKY